MKNNEIALVQILRAAGEAMECKNTSGVAKKWDVRPFQIKTRAKIPNQLRKKSNKPLRSSFSIMGRLMVNDRLENV